MLTEMTFLHVFFLFADFFNWNRVKVRYCDGASFAGDSQNQVCGLHVFFIEIGDGNLFDYMKTD